MVQTAICSSVRSLNFFFRLVLRLISVPHRPYDDLGALPQSAVDDADPAGQPLATSHQLAQLRQHNIVVFASETTTEYSTPHLLLDIALPETPSSDQAWCQAMKDVWRITGTCSYRITFLRSRLFSELM